MKTTVSICGALLYQLYQVNLRIEQFSPLRELSRGCSVHNPRRVAPPGGWLHFILSSGIPALKPTKIQAAKLAPWFCQGMLTNSSSCSQLNSAQLKHSVQLNKDYFPSSTWTFVSVARIDFACSFPLIFTKHQTPSTKHKTPNTKHQAASTKHQAPSTDLHQAPFLFFLLRSCSSATNLSNAKPLLASVKH